MQQGDRGLAFGPPPSMQAMAQASSLPDMSPEIPMAASKVRAARVRLRLQGLVLMFTSPAKPAPVIDYRGPTARETEKAIYVSMDGRAADQKLARAYDRLPSL
jgi:hypothetical protein